MERKSFIEQVRLNAIMDAHSTGMKASELAAVAESAERKVTDKRGKSSVSKFLNIVKDDKIEEIDHIKDSTQREDTEWHTDKWIVLKKPIHRSKLIPLEIKSSRYGVRKVKESEDFKINPICVIINSNEKRKDEEIIDDFKKELQRIGAILDKFNVKKNT